MAAFAGLVVERSLIAHGGLVGGIVESLIVAVVAVFVAVWLRERRARPASRSPARLRDDDETPG